MDINGKLKEETSALGANAVMNIEYRREIRFGLCKVIAASGQPIYIENTENIIKTAPKETNSNIYLGIFCILIGIKNCIPHFDFFSYIFSLFGTYFLFTGVSMWRRYTNKTLYWGYTA